MRGAAVRGVDGQFTGERVVGQPCADQRQSTRTHATSARLGPTHEWHVDEQTAGILDKMGSYPPSPECCKKPDLRAIRPTHRCAQKGFAVGKRVHFTDLLPRESNRRAMSTESTGPSQLAASVCDAKLQWRSNGVTSKVGGRRPPS